jgi:hypothetical protein
MVEAQSENLQGKLRHHVIRPVARQYITVRTDNSIILALFSVCTLFGLVVYANIPM